MKPILFLILLLPSFTYAQKAPLSCKIAEKSLQFKTPTSSDITHTLWQESNEENETVRRLYITYKDGSIAIIKHKFCSTYKFEAAYYMEERNGVTSTEKIKSTLTLFLSYIAHKDNTQKEAKGKMIEELNKYSFDPSETMGASYSGHDPAYGDTGYSILYFPINYSSLHSSAIFMDMGIGGIH